MRVLLREMQSDTWSSVQRCIRTAGGGGGCYALLYVEEQDIFIDERDWFRFVRFRCPECGNEPAIYPFNSGVYDRLPTRTEWYLTHCDPYAKVVTVKERT